MSDQWHVESDLGDSWYHNRIYAGSVLVANILAAGTAGKKIADQIVADHDAALRLAAAEAENALLREKLHEYHNIEAVRFGFAPSTMPDCRMCAALAPVPSEPAAGAPATDEGERDW